MTDSLRNELADRVAEMKRAEAAASLACDGIRRRTFLFRDLDEMDMDGIEAALSDLRVAYATHVAAKKQAAALRRRLAME